MQCFTFWVWNTHTYPSTHINGYIQREFVVFLCESQLWFINKGL